MNKKLRTPFLRLLASALILPLFSYSAFAAPLLAEYEIKAAFLYQFTKFVEWQKLPDAKFNICVIGKDPFGAALDQLAAERVMERDIEVLRMAGTAGVESCQVAFIGSAERHRIGQYLAALSGKSVLTVGESRDFLEKGGLINFTKDGNKIRFQINQKQAEASGIKISSKLLSLAQKVVS